MFVARAAKYRRSVASFQLGRDDSRRSSRTFLQGRQKNSEPLFRSVHISGLMRKSNLSSTGIVCAPSWSESGIDRASLLRLGSLGNARLLLFRQLGRLDLGSLSLGLGGARGGRSASRRGVSCRARRRLCSLGSGSFGLLRLRMRRHVLVVQAQREGAVDTDIGCQCMSLAFCLKRRRTSCRPSRP